MKTIAMLIVMFLECMYIQIHLKANFKELLIVTIPLVVMAYLYGRTDKRTTKTE